METLNITNSNKKNVYKWCYVSSCRSTSISTPGKIFVSVPKDFDRRNIWLKAARRDLSRKPLSPTSQLYCCEDHFNMEEDMENYIRFKLMGGYLKSKKSVVPHRFDCEIQNNVSSKIVPDATINWDPQPLAREALSTFKLHNGLHLALDENESHLNPSMDDVAQGQAFSYVSLDASVHSATFMLNLMMDQTFPVKPSTSTVHLSVPCSYRHTSSVSDQSDLNYSPGDELFIHQEDKPIKCEIPDDSIDLKPFLIPSECTSSTRYESESDDRTTLPFESVNFVIKEEPDDSEVERSVCDDPSPLGNPDPMENSTRIQCTGCSRKFQSKSQLIDHLHTDNSDQVCELMCTYCLNHESVNLNSTIIPYLTGLTNELRYNCSRCRLHFKCICFSTPSKNVGYTCSICKEVLADKSKWQRHKLAHKAAKSLRCSQCDKRFRSERKYMAHIDLHSNERPFACTFCDSAYKFRQHLQHHMAMHESTQSNKGSINNIETDRHLIAKKSVSTAITLRRIDSVLRNEDIQHSASRMVIKQEPVLEMTEIGKMDNNPLLHNVSRKKRTSSKIKSSRNINSPPEWVTCRICFRSFENDTMLARHMNIHTTKRVFKCLHCAQSFSRISSLQIHVKSHTDIVQHLQCPICKSSFCNLDNLILHLKAHAKGKKVAKYTGKVFSIDRSNYRFIYHSKSLRT